MRYLGYATFVLLAGACLGGGPARAINICRADHLTCATTMPVDGYCECTARGVTEGGTVTPGHHGPINATAGGCGVNPGAPGCR
jgi:hypothetical protein